MGVRLGSGGDWIEMHCIHVLSGVVPTYERPAQNRASEKAHLVMGVMAQGFNSSILEAEPGESL